MRMLPSRYLSGKPLQVKKQVSQIAHLSAPLKGLSLDSKLTQADPLLAPILDNWVVDEDKIRVRPGTKLMQTLPGPTPISAIIPFEGQPVDHLLASGGKLYATDNTVLGPDFGSDNWHWTAFSNLGEADYTIMVNGADGVLSWDGGIEADGTPVGIASINAANPAVVEVVGGIAAFHDGMMVRIEGVTSSHAAANGTHYITNVGTPVNMFTLVGVDTSSATGTVNAGATATPLGSLVSEMVTAPSSETWINPDAFHVVLSHMNRLWFADSLNLAVYYLPLQSKTGELKFLPLNAIFRHGGYIVALATWTMDGGAGMDDVLVIFTSHGEAAIYSGTDPDADISMVGVFHFDSPMSKHSICQYGGDLYVLTATGVYAMSGLIKAQSAQSDKTDKKVITVFWDIARAHRADFGWQLLLDHHTGALLSNLPEGGGRYTQMLRFMPNPIWARWQGLKARCWSWLDDTLYFGTDVGTMYRVARDYLNDDGQPILADVQFAWSNYKTSAIKHFKMVLPYMITDGTPKPYVDIQVDYDSSAPLNWPDISYGNLGAEWDLATWDEDYWAALPRQRGSWQGVGKLGRVGAPRIRVSVLDCSFSLAAVDVIYESGSAL